jgi:putative oxygen-independent coproporphyrinogen III oxidase
VADWRKGGFGIYIHWPFCAAKCPYCDFNSHVAKSIDQSSWRNAYLREIDRYAELTSGRVLNSVFFGGGTPSLMPPETAHEILERIHFHWPKANKFECTLEANPTSVDAGRFAGYAAAGVNRISMGIQSLRDNDLVALGRMHTVTEAKQAFDIARDNFNRVSFDLIYARQHQEPESWRIELKEALSMAVDHISAYQLTIEQGTAFGDRYNRGLLKGLPEDENAERMYDITQEECAAAGMPRYEVSNHAAPGQESIHNQVYWRYGDYIGIGPGAHGRITTHQGRFGTEAHRSPEVWKKSVYEGKIKESWTPLSANDQLSEFVLMGMRMASGISVRRLTELSNGSFKRAKLGDLVEMGLIDEGDGLLYATQAGTKLLNQVIYHVLGACE